MTTYNKQTLGTFFENGDVPQGSDFQNLIDSQVNIVETSTQAMGGPLSTTELVTPRVSATNINCTGTVSANNFSLSLLTATNITATAIAAASAVFTDAVTVNSILVSGKVSAAGVNVTGDVSAATGGVYASAMHVGTGGVINTPVIVSAAGTSLGAAAALPSNGIIRLKGITDGSATGFRLLANLPGLQQTLWVEENTSCNLWPPTGGQINALASSAAFGMAGNTQYIVTHIKASGYSVK